MNSQTGDFFQEFITEQFKRLSVKIDTFDEKIEKKLENLDSKVSREYTTVSEYNSLERRVSGLERVFWYIGTTIGGILIVALMYLVIQPGLI